MKTPKRQRRKWQGATALFLFCLALAPLLPPQLGGGSLQLLHWLLGRCQTSSPRKLGTPHGHSEACHQATAMLSPAIEKYASIVARGGAKRWHPILAACTAVHHAGLRA